MNDLGSLPSDDEGVKMPDILPQLSCEESEEDDSPKMYPAILSNNVEKPKTERRFNVVPNSNGHKKNLS